MKSEIDSDTGKAQKRHGSAAPNEEIGVHTTAHRTQCSKKPSGLAPSAVVARFDGSERLFPK